MKKVKKRGINISVVHSCFVLKALNILEPEQRQLIVVPRY